MVAKMIEPPERAGATVLDVDPCLRVDVPWSEMKKPIFAVRQLVDQGRKLRA